MSENKLQTKCIKIKLKPDSLEQVREWALTINSRKDEAIETLRREGIIIESVFLDKTSEGDFLIYYVKAKDLEDAKKAFQRSTVAIDEYHRQFKKETWDDFNNLEVLVDLENFSE
jgi:hypothetical protein